MGNGRKMFKKTIRNLILCLMIVLSSYIIGACCGPKMCKISVNFNDVDELLGLSNYTEIVEAGAPVKVVVDIPEGYLYDNFSAKVGEYNLNYDVKISDPTIEPEYEYTVAKTITISIDRVNANHQIDIDMSGVRIKKLKVGVAKDLLNNAILKEDNSIISTNLQIVTINPEYLTDLKYLRGDAILDQIPVTIDGEAYVEYGNYAIFCFTKEENKQEMKSIYSSVGKFTPENKIIEFKENKYAQFDLAVKGNQPYNLYENNSLLSKTRLYYIGQIKEDMDIYRQIPDFEVTKGFTFENKKNQFVLLTNKQDYNSSLLSISAYVSTFQLYDSANLMLDMIGDHTLAKIQKYNEDGLFKTPDVYSEFGKRYDMLSFYIGENIVLDTFLTQEEKSTLSNDIYLVIESEIPIDELNIQLLSYEKQAMNDFPKKILTNYEISIRNKAVFKIDKSIVNEFIKERRDTYSGNDYLIGNAILYVSIGQKFMEENWDRKEFTTLMYPLTINGSTINYSLDYSIELFVEDKSGNVDYGFIDMQGDNCDVAYFKSSQLYDQEGDSAPVARNDLYIRITGPDYNDYYSPVIETIFLYKPYDVPLVGQLGESVKDPKTFNGLEKYSINVDMSLNSLDNSTFIGRQFSIKIFLNVTTKNLGIFDVDFSNISLKDKFNDAIYMCNNIEFDSLDDFQRVDNSAINNDSANIRFGNNCEIYYFVYSEDEDLEFDIYVGQRNPETNVYEGVYNELRKISETTVLKDILGNIIRVRDNTGKFHVVYCKHQYCDVYKIEGGEHFAYNPNIVGIPQE